MAFSGRLFFLLLLCSFVDILPSIAQANFSLVLEKIPIKREACELQLLRYEQEDFIWVESRKIPEDSIVLHINFSIPNQQQTALYALFLTGGKNPNRLEFLINPKEKLQIKADFWQLMDGSAILQNSTENEAYAQILLLRRTYESNLEELMMRRATVSEFDPKRKRKLYEQELITEQTQFAFNEELDTVATRFPNSFTAKVLVPLAKIPVRATREEWKNEFDSYLSFLHKHYFHYVNFEDAAVLNHYAFFDKIYYYLAQFTEKSTDGAISGIDVLMNSLEKNETVNSFVFNSLLRTFVKLESEALTKHLTEKHASGCTLNLGFEDLKKLQTMQALAIGGTAPPIELMDRYAQWQSLRQFTQKQKLTIVFFWISWCARCEKEMPEMAKLSEKYKQKGLGVFAISLDENREEWLKASAKQPSFWCTVAELVPIAKSKVAPAYQISTTPAIFLLNNKGEIVAKGLWGTSLDSFIENFLKS